MQLSLRASQPQNSLQKPVFWTQMDADSGRGGHLGRDDSGIFHFSDYGLIRTYAVENGFPFFDGLDHFDVADLVYWGLQRVGGDDDEIR